MRVAKNMEENNRPNAPANGAQNNAQHPGAGHSKHRGHRGGKRHNHSGKKPENTNPDTPATVNEGAEAARTQEGDKKPRDNRKNHHHNRDKAPQKNRDNTPRKEPQTNNGNSEKGKNKNNDRRGNKKQPDRRQGRQDHINHKDDIYGDPTEERELAEWRAKIVLNNSAPQKTADPFPFPPEEPEEPVEIPAGIDLLGDTVATAPIPTNEETVEVIGIRFRSAGKVYYFAPDGIQIDKGDHAIVETARGPEFGDVAIGNTFVPVSETVAPLRPLIRRATKEDIQRDAENRAKEKEALSICHQKIAEHKLDMKLIDAQYAFDNSKLLFYFSSEGRVDFRELVKDLASVFRTRIELRQIGIRDEAKMLGGFGACGRLLCCSTFLPDFAQVSIKMAKEQGLSLNSAKISGTCGRLMCCLRFESEVYAAENKLTPSIHSTVKTEDGVGTVISTNPLAGTIRVILKDVPDAPPKQYHRNDVTVLGKKVEKAESEDDASK